MRRRRTLWLAGIVLLALGAGFVMTSGPPAPTPHPPGSFAFAVLGDAPYYPWEEIQYRLVLQDLEAHDLEWVLHVGDIFWRPCSDAMYRETLERFAGLRHPVIYTPGDNEWVDCWEPGSGRFAPRERLARLRELFFAGPAESLGGRRLPLVGQAGEFVEHRRFSHDGVVFGTLHLVGNWNGLVDFEGRTPADDAEARRRTEAAAAWTRETFAEAEARNASAVVLAFHGNPAFEQPADGRHRQAYEPFLAALEECVERFARPVLVTHGDFHVYAVDQPLVQRSTGRRLANFTRLQVPGSPTVGWVRVVVTPGAEMPFAFEERSVPGWKYW